MDVYEEQVVAKGNGHHPMEILIILFMYFTLRK